MSLASFPIELLELISSEIELRADLFAFALTCSRLRNIVIPNHLEYRTLCVSTHHAGVWNHLLERPDLAANIRSLTLYVGHPDAFAPIFRDDIPVAWRAPVGTANFAFWRRTPTEMLEEVFRLMRRARSLDVHVTWIPDDDEVQDVETFASAQDVLDVSCASLSALEDLTICAPALYDSDSVKGARSTVWTMHELKKIDFRAFGQCVFQYSGLTSFCDMLCLSTMLEELHISMDLRVFETLAEHPLPRLKHFYVYNVGTTRPTDEAVVLRFLEAHPGLETLQLPRLFKDWQSSFSKPILPNIRALFELSHVFLRSVLGGRAPGSLRVHTLGNFALESRTLPLLQVLEPDALKCIHLAKLDTVDTLREFATMFPGIKELELPPVVGDSAPRPSLAQRALGHARAMSMAVRGGHVCLWPHWQALKLRDVAPLFPSLDSVHFVRTPMAAFVPFKDDVPGWGRVYNDRNGKDAGRVCRALEATARKYPSLRAVNGWKV